jgi:peptide methionine sulfoxide reductase msrA/msrB
MKKSVYLACGCFWGVQTLYSRLAGVVQTQVGYMGDTENLAHYDIIKKGATQHKEVIEIIYDDELVSYTAVLEYFFEIHDFSQSDGQGGDIGLQYTSVIFYETEQQKAVALSVIDRLLANKYQVATKLEPLMPFYPAESYHQDYYEKTGGLPYCHRHRPIFANIK